MRLTEIGRKNRENNQQDAITIKCGGMERKRKSMPI